MTREQILGKYARLRRELGHAFSVPAREPDRGPYIERIAKDLSELENELEIGACSSIDEQTDDSMLGYLGEAEPPQRRRAGDHPNGPQPSSAV
jgi:hypothetical protein